MLVTLTNDDDADGVGGIMELHRGEVVDDGPGSQHRDDADRGAGHPPALIVISLDPEIVLSQFNLKDITKVQTALFCNCFLSVFVNCIQHIFQNQIYSVA